MIKYFINLSNGIDFLKDTDLLDVHFIRIPSTWCEAKEWGKILFSLSDDFLMYLALGYKCVIFDCSSKTRIPRALWQGLEWIKFALYKIWFDRNYRPEGRAESMFYYFESVYNELPKYIKNKIRYFKKFLLTNDICLCYTCRQTDLDGEYEKLREILKERMLNGNKRNQIKKLEAV